MTLNNSCIALLVLGNLGDAGALSAKSLKVTGIKKICVVADLSGKNWLSQSTSIGENFELCFHESLEINVVINKLSENQNYVNFQSERFIRLMILKWILILDIFKNHSLISNCVYTDLDVIWRNSPIEEIELLNNSVKSFLIQDDTTLDGAREFFCPGIMIWKNTPISNLILKSILEYQDQKNQNGNLLADDKALNQWLKFDNRVQLLDKLPNKKYVIGHRFLWMMTNSNGYNFKNVICFHGNYIIGKNRKYKILQGAALNTNSFLRFYYALIYIVFRIIK